MLYQYGKAVLEERTRPGHLDSLARYLRLEYGEGTEPSWLLANGTRGPIREDDNPVLQRDVASGRFERYYEVDIQPAGVHLSDEHWVEAPQVVLVDSLQSEETAPEPSLLLCSDD